VISFFTRSTFIQQTVPFVRRLAEPLQRCLAYRPYFIKGWQKYNSIRYYPKLNGEKRKNNEGSDRIIIQHSLFPVQYSNGSIKKPAVFTAGSNYFSRFIT